LRSKRAGKTLVIASATWKVFAFLGGSIVRFGPYMSRRLCAALVAAAVMMPAARAQSPSIAGSWSGTGVVRLPSGKSESVKCRATFQQVGTGASMSATCANASTRVSQTAELSRAGGNRYVGEFNNAEFNISGSIRIVLNSASSMTASLNGGGGSANFTLSR
jgi:hypothetical protein